MRVPFAIPTLGGTHVRLEPLSSAHAPDLAAAASVDRSTYDFTRVPDSVEGAGRQVEELLDQWRSGVTIPFAQVDLTTGRAVGMTRYLSIRVRGEGETPYAIEIGGTWLGASAQGTSVNTEAKLLLVDYAFATWGCRRVDFKTDERNARARIALAALGARFEGVLRGWQPSYVPGEGDRYRNSAMYSIMDDEWPDARAGLVTRLDRRRTP